MARSATGGQGSQWCSNGLMCGLSMLTMRWTERDVGHEAQQLLS